MSSQIGFHLSSGEKRKPEGVSILNVMDFHGGNGWHDTLLQ